MNTSKQEVNYELTYGAKCFETGEELTFETKEELDAFMVEQDVQNIINNKDN